MVPECRLSRNDLTPRDRCYCIVCVSVSIEAYKLGAKFNSESSRVFHFLSSISSTINSRRVLDGAVGSLAWLRLRLLLLGNQLGLGTTALQRLLRRGTLELQSVAHIHAHAIASVVHTICGLADL